jgi:glycosyltransferase involved in cell wall biosynthesis
MNKSSKQIDVSIVITTHREGLFAHKTLLSIFRNVELLAKNHITYEIIVHVDNGDYATIEYLKRYKNDDNFRIFYNSFGNPADSRNFSVKKTHGKYIAILDGDDLVSRNWLLDAYQMITKQAKPIILHPNFHLHFGYNEEANSLWIMSDSFTKDDDAIIMLYWNRWNNALFAMRRTLLEFPYQSATDGFTSEDYHFNCQTRSADIPHKIVPGTVLFYRRMKVSVASQHNTVGVAIHYTNFFNINYLKSLPIPDFQPENRLTRYQRRYKKLIALSYKVTSEIARRTPVVKSLATPIMRNRLYSRKFARLPSELIDAWKDINSIENQLYPTKGAIAKLNFHPLSFDQKNNRLGIIICQLLKFVTKTPDYLFLPPELNNGGTEKLMLNYIRAIQKVHPKWQIAIIGARPRNGPLNKAPDVDFIDFCGFTQGLSEYEREIIWSRLLIQLEVRRLHLINNELWYRWIANHQELLIKNNFKIYVSLFMKEYAHEIDRVKSFADPDLVEIYPTVTKVFTDNKKVIDEALYNNAFDPKKFIVHYQPEALQMTPPKLLASDHTLRVLWASRISFQKRPDLLKEIARKVDPDKIRIDAYGRTQDYKKTYLQGIPALTYKGAFDGINSLPTDKYDVYLYTSTTDGLPNILLEIASRGLPIIASDAGGIGEFIINDKTGLLVDIDDIDGYIKALNKIKSNPKSAKKLAIASQKLLKTQHLPANFEKKIQKDIV